MKLEKVIQLARYVQLPEDWPFVVCKYQELKRFAEIVADHEREACAKVCDEFNFGQAPMMIQKAIRAKGQA